MPLISSFFLKLRPEHFKNSIHCLLQAVLATIDAEALALREDPNRDIGPRLEGLRQVHHKQVYCYKNPKGGGGSDLLGEGQGTATGEPDGLPVAAGTKKRRLKKTAATTYLSNALNRSLDQLFGGTKEGAEGGESGLSAASGRPSWSRSQVKPPSFLVQEPG